jgi:hypothetical protein
MRGHFVSLFIHIFKHHKFNLNIMFALNFGTIYLSEFLILIEGVRSNVQDIRLLCDKKKL